MSFETCDLFVRVVIEYSQLEIIAPGDKPVLSCNKFYTADRNISNFECFEQGTSVDVVNVYLAIVKPSENPRFCWVEIDALDTV